MMDWATFMTFCSSLQSWAEQEPYQAVIQPERMLSMVHLLKLVGVLADMLNFLSLLRKYRHWWAFLTIVSAWGGPGQVVSDLDTSELEALDHFLLWKTLL